MGKALAKNTVMIMILSMVILVAAFMCCLEKEVLNEIFNYVEAGFKLVPVTGIAFEQSEYTISSISSDSYQLKLVIYPENASNKKITWTSSDPLIAKVDSDGNIYGKALGTVIIKAKSVDGNFKASCQVTVSNIVTYEDYIINVVTKSIIDYIGADQIVNIPSVIGGVEIETVLSKAFNSDSIFSVSFPYSIKKIESEAFAECENINVIELGSDVLVEANAFCDFNDIDDLLEVYAAGGSGIYYQEYDGWRKIDEILHVSNLTLDTEMITIPANKSNISYNIYSFVEPENAHIYGVSWASSDTSVVTIDSYDAFCSLYGVAAGTAVVTVTSADGRYEAKCIVNVTETVLENGFVFDPETGTIIEYKGTQSNLVIPSSIGGITVKCLGERAICLNDYIKTIEIPSSVVTLGKQSIHFCDNLESVIFQEGSNLKEIEEYTFTSTAITELLLPSSLTKINESVFDSWNDLRYIEIGSDVKIKINERLLHISEYPDT
jgi:uncharacterized protein YjdB